MRVSTLRYLFVQNACCLQNSFSLGTKNLAVCALSIRILRHSKAEI